MVVQPPVVFSLLILSCLRVGAVSIYPFLADSSEHPRFALFSTKHPTYALFGNTTHFATMRGFQINAQDLVINFESGEACVLCCC